MTRQELPTVAPERQTLPGITAIFADNLQVESAENTIDLMEASIFQKFQKFASLGVHFSPRYIEENPQTLVKFNNNIQYCDPAGLNLTERDKETLRSISLIMKDWLSTPGIADLIEAEAYSGRKHSTEQISRLDAQWKAQRLESENDPNSLIFKTYSTPLSQKLRLLKEQNDGLFSEIIVTDIQGLNIGISDIPSDYWQGDEDKFLQTVGGNSSSVFIDKIQFDPSTVTFLSQISLAISNKEGEKIGMMTVGVNVELALKYVPDN